MMHAGDPTLATRLTGAVPVDQRSDAYPDGHCPGHLHLQCCRHQKFLHPCRQRRKVQEKPVKGKEMFLLNQKMRALLAE